MIYNFDTTNKVQATAALLVYAIYRSRDKKRFKITPEMWGQIKRFIEAASKRSKNIPVFIDQFSKKMSCDSINPKWVEVAVKGRLFQSGSCFIDIPQPDKRQFLTEVLNDVDHKQVVKCLNTETQYVVMLVRDRLETEKPLESTFEVEE
jgi:hypothetical protein